MTGENMDNVKKINYFTIWSGSQIQRFPSIPNGVGMDWKKPASIIHSGRGGGWGRMGGKHKIASRCCKMYEDCLCPHCRILCRTWSKRSPIPGQLVIYILPRAKNKRIQPQNWTAKANLFPPVQNAKMRWHFYTCLKDSMFAHHLCWDVSQHAMFLILLEHSVYFLFQNISRIRFFEHETYSSYFTGFVKFDFVSFLPAFTVISFVTDPTAGPIEAELPKPALCLHGYRGQFLSLIASAPEHGSTETVGLNAVGFFAPLWFFSMPNFPDFFRFQYLDVFWFLSNLFLSTFCFLLLPSQTPARVHQSSFKPITTIFMLLNEFSWMIDFHF